MYTRELEQRATCRREAEYRSIVAGSRMPTSALTPGYLALPVNIKRSQRCYYCGHMHNLPPNAAAITRKKRAQSRSSQRSLPPMRYEYGRREGVEQRNERLGRKSLSIFAQL